MSDLYRLFFQHDLKREFRGRLADQSHLAGLYQRLEKAFESIDEGDPQSAAREVIQILPLADPRDVVFRSAAAYLLTEVRRSEMAWRVLAPIEDYLTTDALASFAHAVALESSGDRDSALGVLTGASTYATQRTLDQSALLHLHIARLSTLLGDGERMLRNLALAVETGILNWSDPRVVCVRAFDALACRDHIKFSALLEELEPTSKLDEHCLADGLWLDFIMEGARKYGPNQALIDVAAMARRVLGKQCYSGDQIFAIIRQISGRERPLPSPEETIRLDARIRVEVESSWLFMDSLVRLALRSTGPRVSTATILRMIHDVLMLGLNEHEVVDWAACELRVEFSQRIGTDVEAQFEGWPRSDPLRAAQIMLGWSNFYLSQSDVRGAGLCSGVAAMLAPSNQSIQFSFAHCLATAGLLTEAQAHFVRIGCIAPEAGASIAWPVGWPKAASPIVEQAHTLIPAKAKLPKISVIIPTFNQAWAIEDTILSVLNQGYDRLQLIVMDGGSTDGTGEILARYANHFDVLVSEPDNGQSDAINKGMARADGDLVTWLNSDDMFWPGALHAWASTWLETRADVIFGLCVTHVNKRINVINMPRVMQDDFTVEKLSNISELWMKGHYFYQPEVIFTRSIWERAGGNVDANNYYCMDYDLWLRMAEQGATLACAKWPTALFRYHDNQKTNNLDLCIHEQGAVRDRYNIDLLPSKRKIDIDQRIKAVSTKSPLRVAVISTRADKICASSTGQEIKDHFSAQGIQARFYDNADVVDVRRYDLIVLLVHVVASELAFLNRLKDMRYTGLVVGWYWDNHHLWRLNLDTSQVLDISIPGHAFAGAYLRTTGSALWDAVPLCVTQWTRIDMQAMWGEQDEARPRNRSLYGGFVKYPDAIGRNKRLTRIMESGLFPSLYFVDPDTLSTYFSLSARARFDEWKRYATSFVVPFESDLSQRFFDAWLAGQVPVVAPTIHDLKLHSSLQALEGIEYIQAASDSPSDVQVAHQRALRIFDEGGPAGVRRRHLLALNGHMLIDRLDQIVSQVRDRAF